MEEQEPSSSAETEQPAKPAWDYSNRKVIVHNVLKYEGMKDMTKIVKNWLVQFHEKNPDIALEFEKIKKPPKDTWVVITFKEEKMCQPFVDFINNNNIENKRGGKLLAKPAAADDDQNNKKDKRKETDDADNGDSQPSTKRSRRSEEAQGARRHVTEEEIKDKVIPLWKLGKEEQKTKKTKEMIKRCAIKIVSDLKIRFRQLSKERKTNIPFYPWLEGKRCIEVRDLISAPTPLRNKCEFTFGYRYLFEKTAAGSADQVATTEEPAVGEEKSEPSKVPAVGFMVTGWAGGVSNPHGCDNIPVEICKLVDIVNDFLSTSPLPPYDTKVHQGFWRTMTVRSSRRTHECMVIIMHTPPAGGVGDGDESVYAEHFEKERSRLVSLLTNAELPVPDQEPLKVTSIFFQEFGGLSNPTPDHPVQHVHGKKFLTEVLGKCTFQISPGAFFQVNTEGAEMLYQLVVDKVREVAKIPEKTVLFDVCCGTGTIGLTCLKEGVVGSVIGVDISQPAIEDAKINAGLNGFENDDEKIRFVAARAEQVLHKEIGKVKTDDDVQFIAVVDPAREGLHPDVVRTLRANDRIQRIVYVSCNPTGTLVRDAVMFCQPASKRYSGLPFRISAATPVDMFPLTDHCEMVMTFDRLTPEEMAKS